MGRWVRRRADDVGQGQVLPFLAVLVVFAMLAWLVNVNNENPEIRRINQVADSYASAWQNGTIDKFEFDPLSSPTLFDGDAGKIDDYVKQVVKGIDGTGNLRPRSVTLEPEHTRRDDTDPRLASAVLRVTWGLVPTGLSQATHDWSYEVTVRERLSEGRWRLVWTPEAIHPAMRYGLGLQLTRKQPPRASILGARDAVLPPAGQTNLARAVLGSIVTEATYQQAQLDALRATKGETVGVAGLQNVYDERLAGGAQVQVSARVIPGFTNVVAPQDPLFVGPPQTPKPLKVTLDASVQQTAEAALRGVSGPATLVAVRASTGEVLAVANTTADVDYGLSAQQPPGPVFGMASTLALLRSGYSLTSRIDCSQPFSLDGQVFRNPPGLTPQPPYIGGVTVGAAVEGACTTGLARAAADVDPKALQSAAYDLGIAVPRETANGAPGEYAVGDLLGTPAFHGSVPGSADAAGHAEDLTGEGSVLVSPLSLARAAATVSTGTRRALRLIVDPAPRSDDTPAQLPGAEVAALQEVMSKGVTEAGGSAGALRAVGGVLPHALAGTAGYGTGPQTTRQAWVAGYRGDVAFAVLVPNTPVAQGANPALTVAAAFLRQSA